MAIFNILKKLKNRRDVAKLITNGINPLYNLAEIYSSSLLTGAYDKSWYLFYEFVTNKSVSILEVESIVNELLFHPSKTADNAHDSATLARLLYILENVGKMDNIDKIKLDLWLEEVQKRNWYAGVPIVYSSEFHGFFVALNSFRNKNPQIREILNKPISKQTIRPILQILFGFSLSKSKEDQAIAEDFVKKLVNEYSGIIRDNIIKYDDLEFFAIYLYLISKYKIYDELDRVYPEFEKTLSSILLGSDWIVRTIETARNIQMGSIDDDVIIVRPDEIPIIYPKILLLSLIAIYEAGYDKVAILPAKYQKLAQKIRDKGMIGLPKDSRFLKTYRFYSYSNAILILVFGAAVGYFIGQTVFGVVLGVLFDILLYIWEKRYVEPEIIDLEKE
ncbi:hypothetical protein [Geoglobus ahangari]